MYMEKQPEILEQKSFNHVSAHLDCLFGVASYMKKRREKRDEELFLKQETARIQKRLVDRYRKSQPYTREEIKTIINLESQAKQIIIETLDFYLDGLSQNLKQSIKNNTSLEIEGVFVNPTKFENVNQHIDTIVLGFEVSFAGYIPKIMKTFETFNSLDERNPRIQSLTINQIAQNPNKHGHINHYRVFQKKDIIVIYITATDAGEMDQNSGQLLNLNSSFAYVIKKTEEVESVVLLKIDDSDYINGNFEGGLVGGLARTVPNDQVFESIRQILRGEQSKYGNVKLLNKDNGNIKILVK